MIIIKIPNRLATSLFLTNCQSSVKVLLTNSAIQNAIYRYRYREPVFITLIDRMVKINALIITISTIAKIPAPIKSFLNAQFNPLSTASISTNKLIKMHKKIVIL